MNFGERITQLRKEFGYSTRNEFADKLGIPNTTLGNCTTDVRNPRHSSLKQLSKLFNVSVNCLLCLTDDRDVLSDTKALSRHEKHKPMANDRLFLNGLLHEKQTVVLCGERGNR